MKKSILETEFCVIGGGLSGLAAAVTAARKGVKTVLVHDRPMLGGNASSEIRMWVCGSREFLETGFVEELRLENFAVNPHANYSVWDMVLYGKAVSEPNLTLLLNTSCLDAKMENDRIVSIDAWQLTTYTRFEIRADYFADCSGDSILAEPTGAEYRVGHEERAEFNESIAPEKADRKTMGMSCLMQVREMTEPQKFTPPKWANKYLSDDDLPCRAHELDVWQNFWWLELGGEDDSIHDTEKIREELLKVALGVWDHIKNHGDHKADNWTLDWIGFLPGKRESRRYVGDHLLNQHDVESGGRFDDVVAYGGWTMDDHHPGGFRYRGEPTIFHPAPCDFGIPYRSLYSRNIANLWFAGRNISVTHVALSSTRVMATCACMGEAVGTAASFAVKHRISPRQVGVQYIHELQQELLWNDCYLPQFKMEEPPLSQRASLSTSCGNGELLRASTIRGEAGCWQGNKEDWAEYCFTEAETVQEINIVFDSDLAERIKSVKRLNMRANIPLEREMLEVPETLAKQFSVTAEDEQGKTVTLFETASNHQRLIRIAPQGKFRKIRLTLQDGTPRSVVAFRVR
ncbi:MAG: FAD-dependent oxidoreductase [Lentisphaeria bacterium]|nr:FAD-dependent oxidoreductase [Lentisphaeria bacterium]